MAKKETNIQKEEVRDNIERLLTLCYLGNKRLMPLSAIKKSLAMLITFTHPTSIPKRWQRTLTLLQKQNDEGIDRFMWELYLKENNLAPLHGFGVTNRLKIPIYGNPEKTTILTRV